MEKRTMKQILTLVENNLNLMRDKLNSINQEGPEPTYSATAYESRCRELEMCREANAVKDRKIKLIGDLLRKILDELDTGKF